jgi:hypothetical protein
MRSLHIYILFCDIFTEMFISKLDAHTVSQIYAKLINAP